MFLREELLKAKPWSDLLSVQIKDDIILFVIDENLLEKTKNLLKDIIEESNLKVDSLKQE